MITAISKNRIVIPVITRTLVNKDELAAIISDLVYHCIEGDVTTLNGAGLRNIFKTFIKALSKSDLMFLVRDHIARQGKTTYADWYEDTDAQPIINFFHRLGVDYLDENFPELNS